MILRMSEFGLHSTDRKEVEDWLIGARRFEIWLVKTRRLEGGLAC